jgi:hypothetical protein
MSKLKPETGGPAFPKQWDQYSHDGMTLRDYFAAKAMTRVISQENIKANCGKEDYFDIIAEECYKYADAMLKEREQ